MKNILFPIVAAIVLPVSAFCTATDEMVARLQHDGLVNDYAGVIEPADEMRISNLVAEVQQKTTAAIAVVTVRSLEGGDVVDFAGKLFEKWAIGEKGRDNGILVLASIDDKKLRIEVGYGLEGAINDAKAGRILDEQLIPAFKEGRYGAGLYNAAAALAALVATENKVALTNISLAGFAITNSLAENGSPATKTQGLSAGLVAIGVFVFIVVVIVIIAKKAKKTGSDSGSSGGTFGGSSSTASGPSSGGSSSSSSDGFGGGRAGGGGASRNW